MNTLRKAAVKEGLDAERICGETDPSNTMEGLYIKIEQGGQVIDRMKYVRASFLQAIVQSETHWLDRPIIPNALDKPLSELFLPKV